MHNLQFSKADPGKVFLTESFTPHFDSSLDTSSDATMTNSLFSPTFKALPRFICFPPDVGTVSSTLACNSATTYSSSEFTATAGNIKAKNYTSLQDSCWHLHNC